MKIELQAPIHRRGVSKSNQKMSIASSRCEKVVLTAETEKKRDESEASALVFLTKLADGHLFVFFLNSL